MFPWKRLAENGIGLWYNPLPDDDAKRIRPPHARGSFLSSSFLFPYSLFLFHP